MIYIIDCKPFNVLLEEYLKHVGAHHRPLFIQNLLLKRLEFIAYKTTNKLNNILEYSFELSFHIQYHIYHENFYHIILLMNIINVLYPTPARTHDSTLQPTNAFNENGIEKARIHVGLYDNNNEHEICNSMSDILFLLSLGKRIFVFCFLFWCISGCRVRVCLIFV